MAVLPLSVPYLTGVAIELDKCPLSAIDGVLSVPYQTGVALQLCIASSKMTPDQNSVTLALTLLKSMLGTLSSSRLVLTGATSLSQIRRRRELVALLCSRVPTIMLKQAKSKTGWKTGDIRMRFSTKSASCSYELLLRSCGNNLHRDEWGQPTLSAVIGKGVAAERNPLLVESLWPFG